VDQLTTNFAPLLQGAFGSRANSGTDAGLITVRRVAEHVRAQHSADWLDDGFPRTPEGIGSMSRDEMIEFVEAIVRSTEVRQRASFRPATVGGPVQCAGISAQGFEWIREPPGISAIPVQRPSGS
jgi:hypothetical protein